jgi:hypothetical protein
MNGSIFWDVIVYSGRILPMFRENVLSPVSGLKNKPINQACFQLVFLLPRLPFNPADGGSTLLRKVCKLLPDYMASHPGR